MSTHTNTVLVPYIARARKVLQLEQRANHQDTVVKPGGLEVFVVRWADETSTVCRNAGLDLKPIHRFTEHLEGYRRQDPMQRASSLRAALAILDEMDNHAQNSRTAFSPPPSSSLTSVKTPTPANPVKTNKASDKTDGKAPPALPQTRPQNPIRLEAGMSPGHTSLTLLSADVTAVPGVGPSVAARLHNLGIRTVRDLLFYFPRDHRDYSKLEKIATIPLGEVTTTLGLIWEVESTRTSGGRVRTIATISDDTGKLRVSWFNQPYLQKQLSAAKGSYLVVTGVKQRFGNKIEFSVRSHELPEQGDLLNTGRLVPTYPLTEGLHARALRRFTKWVVDRYAAMVPDHLPTSIRAAGKLMPLPEAISHIHYPENEQALNAARRRLAFDELFLIQLGMQERRTRWQQEGPRGNAFKIDLSRIFIDADAPGASSIVGAGLAPALEGNAPAMEGNASTLEPEPTLMNSTLWSPLATSEPFEATLPFRFTRAQRRVIVEIFADLAQTKPMSRLLQGDVGSGKTVVAAAALLMAAINGYQSVLMAPTEILAEQHARSISAMLEPFQRLGLVIVDEQHRFGVEQRDTLRHKGYRPHMLVMTATPIPRTLALTLYGDLDVSVIDELPPGRQKIIARWRSGSRRDEAYKAISHQIAEGRQAFIICPLIEESETLAVKAVTVEYERLSREVFPTLRLGLLHGAMKPADKDQVMRRFRDHELDILVATSVIEVGIDVANATVMVIEDADRFGLSQLHQLRGRVGRGQHQSYCYVLSADASLQAQERLEVFQATNDGFRLAEEDLRLRGPGDFFGVRQSGVPELRVANLSDTALIELARSLATKLWHDDPYLRKPEHAALRERMHLFWQNFMAH